MRSTSVAVRSVHAATFRRRRRGVTPNSVQMRTIGEPSADAVVEHGVDGRVVVAVGRRHAEVRAVGHDLEAGVTAAGAEGHDRRTAAGGRVDVGAPFDALDAGAAREPDHVVRRQRTEGDRTQSRCDHRRVRFRVAFLIVTSSTRSGRSL